MRQKENASALGQNIDEYYIQKKINFSIKVSIVSRSDNNGPNVYDIDQSFDVGEIFLMVKDHIYKGETEGNCFSGLIHAICKKTGALDAPHSHISKVQDINVDANQIRHALEIAGLIDVVDDVGTRLRFLRWKVSKAGRVFASINALGS